MAIIQALAKWRVYLGGRKVVVYTDHRPLLQLVARHNEHHTARLKRWSLILQSYELELTYIEGRKNVIADAWSRVVMG